MKFKKIVLNNFRQYKGNTTIEFSTDEEKNITVIYGGITRGKTTLLQAFNWALYGRVNLQEPNELLNYEIKNEMEPGANEEVYVEVYIENDNQEYRFKRKQNYRADFTGKISAQTTYETVEKRENDTWKQIGNFAEEINKILPANLSSYFFFDGERIDRISEQQREGAEIVAESVKSILGLEHYTTAIKHLSKGKKSVISELRSRLNTTANDKLETLKRDATRLEEEIEVRENKIKTYKEEIEKLEVQKQAKENVILDNKETYKKQQQKDEYKKRLEQLNTRKTKLYDAYYNFFNNWYMDFFYYGLKEKIEKFNEVLSVEDEGIPEMHSKSIKFLIERGYCLCGEKLTPDQADNHYKALIEEMKKLPPESIGTSISNFKKETKSKINEERAKNFKESIIEKFSDILDNDKEIYEIQDEIEKLSGEIETNIDVGSLEREVREMEHNIRIYFSKKAVAEKEIEDKVKEKEAKEKEIVFLSQYDNKNIEIGKQIEFAERIVKIIEVVYNNKEADLIQNLEEQINKYLSKIYTGERYMKITPDYKFKLMYKEEAEEIDKKASVESEGLGTVKAISFMCGLLEVAKSKIIEEISEKTIYPLVFDAPLSKIDSVHRRNVMECLSEVAGQVIVFTRERKDLEDITNETRAKINMEYNIEKITEKYSKITIDKKEG